MGPLLALMIAASSCTPLDDVASRLAFDLYPMPQEAVQPMLGFHNKLPPQGEDFYTAGVYGTAGDGTGFIFWTRGDEVCDRDSFAPPMWAVLKKLIEGVIA